MYVRSATSAFLLRISFQATRIRTNLEALSELTVRCDRKHDLFHWLGSVKVEGKSVSVARAAGRYPQALTSAWVKAARSDLVKESTGAYRKGKTRVRPLAPPKWARRARV